ncbi:MFS transporter [Chloroflexota bacterium]
MDKISRIYRQRWYTLAVLSLSLIIVVIDNTILNVALPTMQQELGATGSELQWMVDAYILVFASLLFTMGSLADKIGRANMLRAGMVIFAGGSLWAMTAGSPDIVVAARAIMGIGAACIMPATLAVIMHVFPPDERGKAIGIWASLSGIGIALGPIIGGLLIEYFSWSAIFFINIPIAIIALTAGAFFLPNSKNPTPQNIDYIGTILSAGALGILVYGLINGGERGWSDTTVIGYLVGSVGFGILFVLWERHSVNPMLEIGLFRNRRFSAGAAGIALMILTFFGIVFGLTLYMQFVQGYSALETGIRFLPMAAGFAIGSGTSHRRVSKFGTTYVVAAGFLGIALLFAGASFWGIETPYWILGPMLFAIAFCAGNNQATNIDSVISAVPLSRAGVGSAMNSVSGQVGGAIGVAALGSVLMSEYTSSIRPALADIQGLPAGVVTAAEGSVGEAMIIADQLPPDVGSIVTSAASNSFIDGWQVMSLVACGVAIVATIIAIKFMPPRPLLRSKADITVTCPPKMISDIIPDQHSI